MMRFIEWPWALTLVVILPVLAMFIFRAERRSRSERLAKLGTRSMLVRLAPYGARLGPGRTTRIVGALLLCGVAFAGPRWGLGAITAHSNGVDVALALDASLSMMAPDVPPTRLENMKNVVRQLRAQSPNDRFALLAFAGHSYILSPLTTDQNALDLYLNNLDPTTVGLAGTSLASAIKQATTLLSLRHGDASRAIVVMSDGEDFEPMADVTAEAKRAGEAGITLITVGFGTGAGSTIPVKDTSGRITMKKDITGNVVVTRYTPSFLRQAAQAAAHGVFIPAEAPNKAEQIRRVLNTIKSEMRGTEVGKDFAPQFQWFTLLGLLLLVLDTFIVLRPRRRVLAVGAAALAVAGCAEHVPPAKQQRPPPVSFVALYNKGTKLLGKDSLKAADTRLDSAMASDNQTVRYRAGFNGGWSHFANGMDMTDRLDRAIKTKSLKKVDSVMAAIIAPDSAWADSSIAADAQDSAADAQDTTADASPANGLITVQQLHSRGSAAHEMRLKKVRAIFAHQMDQAVMRYRTALMSNPNDPDAKWNYELALKNGSNGTFGKGRGKKRQKKNAAPRKAPGEKRGRVNSKQPPVKKLELPQQQAEQLLNAAGQNDQRASKAVPVPVVPHPQGKDW